MDYETIRFVSWSGFRVAAILFVHYLFSLLDLFFGCLVLLLVAVPVAILYYHIPPPPKATVQKIFAKLDSIKVGAHRGAHLDAPENSLAALYKCEERGCRMIEFDVSFTADDQAVVFHDSTVDRISDGSGSLATFPWAELKQLNIAAKHPNKQDFPATRVALLSEMVEECLRLDMLFFIDIKDRDARAVSAVLALYEKFPKMYEMAVVSSFFPTIVYEVRRRDRDVIACLGWRPHLVAYADYSPQDGATLRRYSNPLTHVAACAADMMLASTMMTLLPFVCGLSVLLLHKDSVTAATVRRARELDLRLVAWTVNAPAQKAHMARYMHVPYLTDTLVDDDNLAAERAE